MGQAEQTAVGLLRPLESLLRWMQASTDVHTVRGLATNNFAFSPAESDSRVEAEREAIFNLPGSIVIASQCTTVLSAVSARTTAGATDPASSISLRDKLTPAWEFRTAERGAFRLLQWRLLARTQWRP
jgi:hypothetical protein